MSTYPIVKAPAEVLSQRCEEFSEEEFQNGAVKLIEKDLLDSIRPVETMAAGLAANQIGVPKRMFIMKDRATKTFMTFVNPKITKRRKTTVSKEEGCLSLDKFKLYDVPRYERVTVVFKNAEGVSKKLKFRGFEAICIQHEIDHLNGLLISDEDENAFDGKPPFDPEHTKNIEKELNEAD